MGQSERASDESTVRVSDAMGKARDDSGLFSSVRYLWRWLLVDANRWAVVGLLAIGVFVVTLIIGLFGPVSVRQFLLEGTSAADSYIEIQTAIITLSTIVLAINQLVLSPEIGPPSKQRQRLEDVIDHRTIAENKAGVATSPTEPAKFLGTITEAIRKRAATVDDAFEDADDPELQRHVREYTGRLTAESTRIGDTLTDHRFGQIGMLGAAMHFDTTHHISRIQTLLNEHAETLSLKQEHAMNDMFEVVELYTIAREYIRMLYMRSEFIKFSRMILYTALPAFLVSHYAVEIIGPNALLGTTLGVLDLLWFECFAITASSLPLLVLISYIGRLVTLAEASIFIGPFLPRSDDS